LNGINNGKFGIFQAAMLVQQWANHCCYKISTIIADYNNDKVIRPHLYVYQHMANYSSG